MRRTASANMIGGWGCGRQGQMSQALSKRGRRQRRETPIPALVPVGDFLVVSEIRTLPEFFGFFCFLAGACKITVASRLKFSLRGPSCIRVSHNAGVRPSMANSRGRRKLRRMLQEAGLTLPQPPPAKPPQQRFANIWVVLKKIPRWSYFFAGILAVLVGIVQGYPWLSIEEGYLLDPSNPYSELFVVKNTGYIPVTHLDALCNLNFTTNAGGEMRMAKPGFGFMFPDFADSLGHEDKRTPPCFRVVGTSEGVKEGATLVITITYSLWKFNARVFRRSQTFRFRSVSATDGSQHWEFLS